MGAIYGVSIRGESFEWYSISLFLANTYYLILLELHIMYDKTVSFLSVDDLFQVLIIQLFHFSIIVYLLLLCLLINDITSKHMLFLIPLTKWYHFSKSKTLF